MALTAQLFAPFRIANKTDRKRTNISLLVFGPDLALIWPLSEL